MKFGYQTVRWGWGRVGKILPRVLDEISTAGFNAVETNDIDVVAYLDDGLGFSKMLSEKEIQMVGVVVSSLGTLLQSSWSRFFGLRQIRKFMKFANTVGCEKFILTGPITASARKGVKEKEYTKLSQILTEIGEECRALQLELSYHPVVNSIGATMTQIKRLLETDHELVNLTLDTGHLSVAGLDPLEIIEAFGDRINHVHLKGVKAGIFAEPGEGTDIDVSNIMKSLRSIGYDSWVIIEDEVLDNPPPLSNVGHSTKSPMETAINSKKFMENLMKSI